MHKFLKSFLVASLAVSTLTACSSAVPAKGIDIQTSSNAKDTRKATPTQTATSSTVGSAPVDSTNTSPATTSTNGIHAITVGLGASENNQVQPQPAKGTCHVGKASNGQPLPDPNCTPGTTNPAVTQDNLSSTICKSGYTSSIRPSASITGREKAANAASYSYTGNLGDAEYDHLISLELGGSPNDPKNLWVEPGGPNWKPADKFRNDKDAVENKLNAMICSHQVTLAAAQSAIANDWTTALETAKVG
jgi:hypothetical protein